MTALVILSSALLCISGRCYPALVGLDTPVGVYEIQRVPTQAPGYGGDVLEFKETEDYIFAIHRVWTRKPREQRVHRLLYGTAEDRRGVTKGCVNVMPDVYQRLVDVKEVRIVP